MADDPKKTGTPDNDLLSLTQTHEIRSWTARYNTTEAKLREAVAKVGNSRKALDQFFGK